MENNEQLLQEKEELDSLQFKVKYAELYDKLDKINLIESIKEFLLKYYQPVADPLKANLHFTTEEIYHQIQELYPSDQFTAADVAIWMKAGGFTFWDFGEMKFEWLLKKT